MNNIQIELSDEQIERMGYGVSGKWADRSLIAGDVERIVAESLDANGDQPCCCDGCTLPDLPPDVVEGDAST